MNSSRQRTLTRQLTSSIAIGLIASSIFSGGEAAAQSQASFRYDFEEAEIPAALRPSRVTEFAPGTRTIEDGSYVITATPGGGSSSLVELGADNVIIESQVRFFDVQPRRVDVASLTVRDLIGDFDGVDGNPVDGLTGYSAVVDTRGVLGLYRWTPGVGVDPTVLATADGFDAVNQDLKLRFVVDGPTIELFAWPATETIPLNPQLVLNDPNPWLESDYVALGNTTFDPAGVPSARVAFRYLDVTVVPEPSGAVLMLAGIALVAKRKRRHPAEQRVRSSIRPRVIQAVLCLGILVTQTSASWCQEFTFREDFDDSQFPENLSFVPPPGLVAAGIDGMMEIQFRATLSGPILPVDSMKH